MFLFYLKTFLLFQIQIRTQKTRNKTKMCRSNCCKSSSCCKSYSYCKPACYTTECVEVVPKIEVKQCYDVVCKEKVVRYNEIVPRLEVKQSYDLKPACAVTYCEPACCPSPCASYSYPPCNYQIYSHIDTNRYISASISVQYDKNITSLSSNLLTTIALFVYLNT